MEPTIIRKVVTFTVPQYILDKSKEYVDALTINSNVYGPDKSGYMTTLTGVIGENTVRQMYGLEMKALDFEPDLVLSGYRVDVKTQNHNAGIPNPDWWVNFCGRQKQVDNGDDYLLFAFFNHKDNKIRIQGAIPKDQFFQQSIFIPKGDKLPNAIGAPATTDTHCIQAKELTALDWGSFKPTWELKKNVGYKN